MSNTQGLQKYWTTACDEQRRVIFNKIITTGSLAEAQMIAESYVPAEHHGSICIADESNNPIIGDDTKLPALNAVSVNAIRLLVSPDGMRGVNAHLLEAQNPLYTGWTDLTDLDDAAFEAEVTRRQLAAIEV